MYTLYAHRNALFFFFLGFQVAIDPLLLLPPATNGRGVGGEFGAGGAVWCSPSNRIISGWVELEIF